MLTVAMAFAACYGVLQLAVLGWPARSVGLGTLLLAVGVGMYGAGVVGVLLELGYTRALAAVTGDPLFEVVGIAGYTVDPFIEEIIKMVPLLLVALHTRTRTQWGLTDYLLVGAGVGAGFGLLEAVMRFSHRAGDAIATDGGWLLPLSLAPPFIPGVGTSLISWLPAPVSSDLLSFSPAPDTYLHLAWSAVAGFGIGFALRTRGPLRLLGIVPLLLVATDHAAYNFDVDLTAQSRFGDLVTTPFVAAQPVLWLWPLLALAVAVVLDLRLLHQGRARRPELLLAGEHVPWPARLAALPEYATHRPPWTVLLALRFARMRRAALFGAARPGAGEAMVARVAEVRSQLDATGSSVAWRGRGLRDLRSAGAAAPGRPGWLRRYWPLLVWAVLFLPPLAYFVIGSTPGAAGLQDALGSGVIFPVVLLLAAVGLLWVGWGLVAALRALPTALRLPDGSALVRVELQALVAVGAVALGVITIGSWLGGTAGGDPVISNLHVLDALSSLLLAAGLALLLAAFVFFPPFGAVALAGGGVVIVPTLTAGFLTLGSLGLAGVMLSQAVGSTPPTRGGGGGGGGRSVPDIPQQPPAPKPPVRHWRLRNIVDNLWHGSTRPNRVGNGTTMDAVRNELLTGRPTNGVFHSDKARQAVQALDRWIRQYGPEASRADRLQAHRLRAELLKALGGG